MSCKIKTPAEVMEILMRGIHCPAYQAIGYSKWRGVGHLFSINKLKEFNNLMKEFNNLTQCQRCVYHKGER